jgi:LacI family transcriptional regulator
MGFKVNRKSVSQQLVEHFREQIEAGEYKVGDEFPSERILEQQLGISRKTISKVVSVLAGMGYLFKEQGRTTYVADFRHAARTVSGERNFGIFFPSPEEVYHPALSAVFTGMCNTLQTAEYGINLFFFGNVSAENLQRQIQKNPISGCFLFSGGEEISHLNFALKDLPVVTLCSGTDESVTFSAVTSHVVKACGDAVEEFAAAGKKSIAFIYGKSNWQLDERRKEIFKEKLQMLGLPCNEEMILPSEYERTNTEIAVEKLLSCRPDAIVAADDMVGCWIVEELKKHNISVPHEIAVIGFNDMTMYSRKGFPELTTYAIPADEIVRLAVQEMSRRIAHPESAPEKILVPMHFCKRDSF